MKPLALTLALCALVASGSAAAEQTCKAKATRRFINNIAWRLRQLRVALAQRKRVVAWSAQPGRPCLA
jgi:hypothetical protein